MKIPTHTAKPCPNCAMHTRAGHLNQAACITALRERIATLELIIERVQHPGNRLLEHERVMGARRRERARKAGNARWEKWRAARGVAS